MTAQHPTTAHVTAAAVFAVCGIYQLTTLKDRCLAHCRSPLGLLLHYGSYRGRLRDLRVGAHHGGYCLGCCWALMVILVAVGMMNVVPGFIVTNILWGGMGTAVGVAEDVEHGFTDRLRSLPIPRAAVLIGRGLADVALMAWALAIATGLGFAVGFRPGGSAAAVLAAFGLCVVFGLAFEWVFIAGGLVAGSAQAAQSITGLAVTPLVFLSSAYVPVQSMPSGVKQFGEIQPITPMADAVRSLFTGAGGRALLEHSTSYYVGVSLIWAAAIFVVFGLVAVVRFARR